MFLIFFVILVIINALILTLAGLSWLTAVIIIDLFFIVTSVRIVQPNDVKAVMFLWKFNRILRQGLNFIVPILEGTKSQVLYKRNFPIDVDWMTQDNVTAYIWLNVIYYVEDEGNDTQGWNIYKSIFSIDDPRTMMKAIIDEQLRAMIVTFTHKNIFEKREEIWEAIELKLREKLSSFWYKLDSIQVKDVKLEAKVMDAMNKIIETEKFKEAAMNEAEAKKIMQVKQAEAEKESKILLWEWMAGQRMKIAEWFKESVDLIKKTDDSLNAEKVLNFLLDSSRIETLWTIWTQNNSKLIYLNENLEWKTSRLVAWSDIMK